MARAQIAKLAERGRPRVWEALDNRANREIIWPIQEILPNGRMVPDTFALFTWLHEDQLVARIEKEIDAEAQDGTALTQPEREKRVTEILGSILAIEREEVSVIELFRSDTDPRAFLSVHGRQPWADL